MSPEPIRDFILSNEQNLRIAAAVSEAWPETRGHIADTFLNKLGTRVRQELPGWKTALEEQFFVHRYPCFYLFKECWADEYAVTLQADHHGSVMQFGVQRNEEALAERPLSPEVLSVVQTVQPSARANRWWDALVPMRLPAADWRTPNVLWQMYTSQEFLDAVAEQLLDVARTTEPILDRLTAK